MAAEGMMTERQAWRAMRILAELYAEQYGYDKESIVIKKGEEERKWEQLKQL